MLSLLAVLPCVFVLVSSQAWNLGRQAVKQWLQENHGDKKVTLILIFLYETRPYTHTCRSMMLLEHVLTGWTGTTRRFWPGSSSPQLSIFSSLSCWFSAPCFTSDCYSFLGWWLIWSWSSSWSFYSHAGHSCHSLLGCLLPLYFPLCLGFFLGFGYAFGDKWSLYS